MSFPVKMWSGLVEEKHYRSMGMSIWLYLWMVARITKEIDGKGYVLGGKPIKDNEIREDFGTNEKTIRRWRNTLTKMSYLENYKTPYGMVYFVNKSKKFQWGGRTEVSTSLDRSVQNKLRYKVDIKDIYSRVITHLNNKSGSNYKSGTRSTKKVINGRISEGFTEEDFKRVIDNKVKDWKGTDMEKYLRPTTLFNASKFEGYLNERKKKVKYV